VTCLMEACVGGSLNVVECLHEAGGKELLMSTTIVSSCACLELPGLGLQVCVLGDVL
jgi:hypothetical protein